MSDGPHEGPVLQPLHPGDPVQVAGYRLAARLGSGGMGVVYLAHSPAGQPLALKVIRPDYAEDPAFLQRFAHEVAAARRVHGVYTVPVVAGSTTGPQPWLATAYVAAPSLQRMLRAHGPLPPHACLLLTAGIAEALQSIHEAGIVHRDLKPGNVLLAADGPKVIDFGIARAADGTTLTRTGEGPGTPGFMAPEQFLGSAVTPAADVFSLGVLAHVAATGRHPFGDGNSHVLHYRMIHEAPDLADCPPALRDLVAACLAKDPARRPAPAEVIAHCARAAGPGGLSRGEDWLSQGLATELGLAAAAQRQPSSPHPPLPHPPLPHPPLPTAAATAAPAPVLSVPVLSAPVVPVPVVPVPVVSAPVAAPAAAGAPRAGRVVVAPAGKPVSTPALASAVIVALLILGGTVVGLVSLMSR
ncbi:serine/threonine-protein kinase [Kitasatospora cineracea]|uniref:serine/threonine-protein kinase n=1 Tax=Kitasatospora cineracea TaxID=88074 RepID=UPI003815540E